MRSGLSAGAILVDGTIHERVRLPFESDSSNCGEGGVFKIQIPPGSWAASTSCPSAEQAKVVNRDGGTLFDTQEAPKFVELSKALSKPTDISVEPFAELAIESPNGAL